MLPDLKDIHDVAQANFDMMELMEETLETALQAVQPLEPLCSGGETTRPERSSRVWTQRIRIWQGDFYFLGLQDNIEGIPHDVVRVTNTEFSSQAKLESTSASGAVVGAEWCPPVVVAEVQAVQFDERVMFGGLDRMDVDFPKKSKGKETAGTSVLVPVKKKAAELAKRAIGGESQVVLSLKELA
ncbi:hypothetical protein VP01_867g6, partial [Puccinia sorghi]